MKRTEIPERKLIRYITTREKRKEQVNKTIQKKNLLFTRTLT